MLLEMWFALFAFVEIYSWIFRIAWISFSFLGFKCPVCSKFVPSDEMDLHLVMCLTKPRITYNGKYILEHEHFSIIVDFMKSMFQSKILEELFGHLCALKLTDIFVKFDVLIVPFFLTQFSNTQKPYKIFSLLSLYILR